MPVDGAGYQTRSVALAPGVYRLRWHPRPQLDPSPEQAALERANAASSAAHTVVIASKRVTALTVRSTLDMTRAGQPLAAMAHPPE
ncbi:MAG TPA: hypothetical protein VFS67_02190 [Polyangiaceae bacterium]|nr:hypothetical protein [Polyangiaceae bacterium]